MRQDDDLIVHKMKAFGVAAVDGDVGPVESAIRAAKDLPVPGQEDRLAIRSRLTGHDIKIKSIRAGADGPVLAAIRCAGQCGTGADGPAIATFIDMDIAEVRGKIKRCQHLDGRLLGREGGNCTNENTQGDVVTHHWGEVL